MTDRQAKHYWRLWYGVRKADPKADRHALHEQALGYARSSKALTNGEFDKVKAVFLAISQPDNIDHQMAQDDQPETRYRFALRRYAAALGEDDDWLLAIAKQMARQGKIRIWQTNVDDLPLFVLRKLIAAVKIEAKRVWPAKEDIVDALKVSWTENDIDEASALDFARKTFNRQDFPAWEDWSYDDLLTLIGAERQRSMQPF